ncbi:MAG: pseudouridine synthase [Smithellaceae bacterium]|nr:pseudouridine synthase [Smithellaceae bacterium]
MSKSGVCSRKQALKLVKEGKVAVNGRIVTDPGKKVMGEDCISVNGGAISTNKKRYILLHKPAGYVTTRNDELGRDTVYEFLKDVKEWVFPVGRLDKDSEGLLLFTNDTRFGDRLTDPKYRVPRTYKVTVKGVISQDDLARLRKGIEIGHEETAKAETVNIIGHDKASTVMEIMLTEGKNREIRRMFECLKKPVLRLIRTRFGPYAIGSTQPGKWREISPHNA